MLKNLIELLIPEAHAQDLSTLYAPGAAVGGKTVSIATFVSVLIQNASILIGIFAFFTLIIAGVNFISGGGDAKKAKQASDMITYALIGMVLSVLAYWLTRIIFTVAGQNIF